MYLVKSISTVEVPTNKFFFLKEKDVGICIGFWPIHWLAFEALSMRLKKTQLAIWGAFVSYKYDKGLY